MSDIKIFVSCHKPSEVLQNNLMQPIQVGCALTDKRFENMLHDNEGENISEKNRKFCELTAQYYAWKNIDADYYGFFHYRRYLLFNDKKFAVSGDAVPCEQLDNAAIEKFGLKEEKMREFIERYDVIAPAKTFILHMYTQYIVPTTQNKKDFDFCIDYIIRKYPEMKKTVKKALNSPTNYFYNMFVMKKEIFHQYCAWLFDVLSAHEQAMPDEHYDVQSYRVSGFLAERLCSIYLQWLHSKKDIRFKEVQKLMIRNTDIREELKPQTDDTCPILINLDRENFLSGAVAVNSVVKNANKDRRYLLLLNAPDLTSEQNEYLKALKNTDNIRFRVLRDKCLKSGVLDAHFAEQFKNLRKMICLPADCIADTDLYTLFEMPTDSAVASPRDLNAAVRFGKTRLEFQEKKMAEHNEYNTIGREVMLVDLHKLQADLQQNTLSEQMIPLVWNTVVNTSTNWAEKIYTFTPHDVNNEYVAAVQKPNIIQYQGKIRPLNNPMCVRGDLFWKYADGDLLRPLCTEYLCRHRKKLHKSAYDKLFPVGSPLRLFMKQYIKKY